MPDHKFGWKPDLPDYRDYKLADFESILPTVDLPANVDMRPLDFAIRDQGQLGSCTAFTGEAAFRLENKKQGFPDFSGSPLFLYYQERIDQGTVQSDSGASIREISKALATYGIPPEQDWPYMIANFKAAPYQQAYTDALQHKVTQYLSVPQDLAQMKSCLASGYPIMIGFSVYQNLEQGHTPLDGIVDMPSGPLLGGHANLLLGYDDSRQEFISRNSWGTSFGDKGYLYFPYSYLLNSGLASDFWTLRLVSGNTPPTPTPSPQPNQTHTIQVFSDGSLKVS